MKSYTVCLFVGFCLVGCVGYLYQSMLNSYPPLSELKQVQGNITSWNRPRRARYDIPSCRTISYRFMTGKRKAIEGKSDICGHLKVTFDNDIVPIAYNQKNPEENYIVYKGELHDRYARKILGLIFFMNIGLVFVILGFADWRDSKKPIINKRDK